MCVVLKIFAKMLKISKIFAKRCACVINLLYMRTKKKMDFFLQKLRYFEVRFTFDLMRRSLVKENRLLAVLRP